MKQLKISQRMYITISIVLFAVYFVNGMIAIPELSITVDEGDHMSYAARFAKGHPEKVRPFDDASTMPISVFNMIPRIYEQILNKSLEKTDGGVSDIFSGRYVTLVIGMFTGLLVLIWSTKMYGSAAGLFSLFLFVFSPNINAHSVLVTTDAYSALFTIMSAYFYWRIIQDGGYKSILLFAVALGMAQLAKQSLTHLFFIFPLLYLFVRLKEQSLFKKIRTDIIKILFAALITVAVINIGFQFKKTGMSLQKYQFRSSFFNEFQKKLSILNSIPLPFPEPYVQGLDLTKNMDEMGGGRPESSGNIYLLGESRAGRGFWYYYFVVLFFKTPIPVLILVVLFLANFRKGNKGFWRNEIIPIFIIVYLLIYFDFFYKSQVGIRHIIMIFPLLYVILGKVLCKFKRKGLVLALLVYLVASFYYYFPNLIAYTNELIIPKRTAYKFMADSNIDYGQSNFWLKEYLQDHPKVKMVSEIPSPGRFIIGINDYLDLNNQHKYKWLQNFKPVAQIQHSFLLFDIDAKDLKKIKS